MGSHKEDYQAVEKLIDETVLCNRKKIEIKGFKYLKNLPQMRKLSRVLIQISIYECPNLINIDELTALKKLETLTLFDVPDLVDVSVIGKLNHIHSLRIDFCGSISNFNFLIQLRSTLKSLRLSGIEGKKALKFLEKLVNLKTLSLSYMGLSDISFLKQSSEIEVLELYENNISDLTPLGELENLKVLDVEGNFITDILQLLPFIHLQELLARDNPIIEEHGINLDSGENSISTVESIVFKMGVESNRRNITLPSKVLFLGNHASGKSSLVSFLTGKSSEEVLKSTHILNVEQYSNKKGVDKTLLPEALFYDFGGQDYYHGIYRVFVSQKAVCCLLWHPASDFNKLEIDSEGLVNRHFCTDYWLGYWRHYNSGVSRFLSEKKVENNNYSAVHEVTDSPLLAIQTRADKTEKMTPLSGDELVNQHFVSFCENHDSTLNNASLDYLKVQLDQLIKKNQKVVSYEIWYSVFLQRILNKHKRKTSAKPETVKSWLKLYNREEEDKELVLKNLKTELVQLHRQGLVLYYPDVNQNLFWPSPSCFARHVHEDILAKACIEKYNGVVPLREFDDFDESVIEILEKEKVLFKHKNENREEEFLIPNYLPLAEEQAAKYRLSTFGFQNSASFTLWFHEYLPLGLINQLVCHFGKQPDDKQFWRDQLLFSLESSTDHPSLVLIKLKFDERLQIQVFINNECMAQKKLHTEYVYNVILSLYFDLDTLDSITDFKQYFSEYEKIENHSSKHKEADQSDIDAKFYGIFAKVYKSPPKDLWLSLDGENYINGHELAVSDKETRMLSAINVDKEKQTNKQLPIGDFGAFTHKPLNQQLKVFISYSHDDMAYRNDLQRYLVNLERESIIELWQDGMIKTGEGWNKVIINAMEQADIVIMLVSQSFISSSYVHSVEMPKALALNEQGKARIFPILLSQCDYQNWKVLPESCRSPLADENGEVKIGQFQFFPQDEEGRLKPVNRCEHPEEVWTSVAHKLRELSRG